jgi:hypothetical protein
VADLDQHKENPSKLKTENGGISHIGMTKLPTEAPFFYSVDLSNLFYIQKKEPMICELSHKFIGSASARLDL